MEKEVLEPNGTSGQKIHLIADVKIHHVTGL
jgi:hypothetical protein